MKRYWAIVAALRVASTRAYEKKVPGRLALETFPAHGPRAYDSAPTQSIGEYHPLPL
jgi:hypothetical protein